MENTNQRNQRKSRVAESKRKYDQSRKKIQVTFGSDSQKLYQSILKEAKIQKLPPAVFVRMVLGEVIGKRSFETQKERDSQNSDIRELILVLRGIESELVSLSDSFLLHNSKFKLFGREKLDISSTQKKLEKLNWVLQEKLGV